MARDYLMSALVKKPVLLSLRFNPDEYVIDTAVAKAESTVEHHTARAKLVFNSWDDPIDSKPFAYSAGVAVIPITGVLLNRCSYAYDFATGYNAIRSQLQAAMADPDVQGVIFDVNSPGGMVQGCFELADEIYAARGTKPMMAIVDGNACSAAYALASAADEITATRSADVGSIGVLMMHADLSGMLEKEGVDVTFIYAGQHKVDGNPYEPLPKGVKADLQASIDSTYEEFVALVARNRGLDPQAIRDTEAQVYGAHDAKEHELIDDVATPAEAIASFRSELTGSSKLGAFAMTEKVTAGAADPTAPDLKALAATAAAEATTQERARINAILTSDEAKERGELATYLALSTDMTVDAAKGVLKASPVKAAPVAAAADTGFKKAMDTSAQPNISAGADPNDKKPDLVAQILANFAQASGQKIKAA